jgi:hypothetical protein
MKFRISLTLFLLTLALSASSSVAYACDDATIKGTYDFQIHGTIFLPDGVTTLLVDGVAKTRFDGKGNLTQLDAVATNGNVAPGWRLSTGSYSVNSNCTGTFTVTNGELPSIHAQMLVAQSGNKIHLVVIDPGFATTSEGEREQTPKPHAD